MIDKTISKSEYLDFVEGKFKTCFSEKGYIEETSVNVTSKIDPTVDFIGSNISPLKKYLDTDDYGDIGRYIVQECMKFKSFKYLQTDIPQKFGCYYRGMGIIAKPELERVVKDTFDYLTDEKYLNIPLEDLCIKVSSTDEDLIEVTESVDGKITRIIDQCGVEHYRHRYGMNEKNVFGRDFNIGLRKTGTDDFLNFAAFVIMENNDRKLAIDMGISNLALSMCKFGTSSTVSSSRIADFLDINCIVKEKFADSLVAVATLLKEDVTNHISKHLRMKFRLYLRALNYWNQQLQYSEEDIIDLMVKYLTAEYHYNFEYRKEEFHKVLTLQKKRMK